MLKTVKFLNKFILKEIKIKMREYIHNILDDAIKQTEIFKTLTNKDG